MLRDKIRSAVKNPFQCLRHSKFCWGKRKVNFVPKEGVFQHGEGKAEALLTGPPEIPSLSQDPGPWQQSAAFAAS